MVVNQKMSLYTFKYFFKINIALRDYIIVFMNKLEFDPDKIRIPS